MFVTRLNNSVKLAPHSFLMEGSWEGLIILLKLFVT